MSFTLAASAEMLYLDRPLADRVKRITERGMQVEIWDWSGQGHRRARRERRDVLVHDRIPARRPRHAGRDRRTAGHGGASRRGGRAARLTRLNLHGTGLDGKGLPVAPSKW